MPKNIHFKLLTTSLLDTEFSLIGNNICLPFSSKPYNFILNFFNSGKIGFKTNVFVSLGPQLVPFNSFLYIANSELEALISNDSSIYIES